MRRLQIVRTGALALIEDLGRPGLAALGVGAGGAADRGAHALANRLLANPAGAATVEVTLGGFAARVLGGDVEIAVTGADAGATVDGTGFAVNTVQPLRAGQLLELAAPSAGVRSYLAVRGGIAVAPVLGSRSRDLLSGIGPAPLRAGDLLPIGAPGAQHPPVRLAPVPAVGAGPVELRVLPGPRRDWFTDPDALLRTAWTVGERADRVGIRLVGAPLRLREPGRQLPPEGLIRGAIQVPPNGLPVILGADHPVTGGYPVIGVIADADTDRLAQLRPGQPLRLCPAAGLRYSR